MPGRRKNTKRTPEQRARAREATRACREREKKRLALAVVAFDHEALSALINQRYLSEVQASDKQAINRAMSHFIWDQTRTKFR